ncbi:carbohydrate ABC transporter permease [Streptomyces sp. NBC_01465]|uniref:carbohydrate ABC transporter permease n=1 Tax=Streptomyces sp. NBC_01465 TaxID=2903878 RepID=UPI002E3636E0|nr:carbohydrate ABC transporter permease [Streptomyces sp. NBC_01465]
MSVDTKTPHAPSAAAVDKQPPVRPTRSRTTRSRGGATASSFSSRAVVNTILVIMAFYTLMPLTWLIFASTKNNGDLFAHPGFELGDFNLFSNLRALFSYNDGIFATWLGNSMLYSVVGAAASAFISLLAGYAFDKYNFPLKNKMYGVVLLGILVPSTVVSLPMYLMASKVGLVNTYWAVLIPGLVNPFGVYLARVFSEGYVPGETLEAARMDGASEIRLFRSVSLPMMAPAFMTIFLFSFTGSWNNFFLPLVMLNDSSKYPVTLGIYNWNQTVSQYPEFYQLVITGSLISVIPLAIAFLGLQRYWRSGLTAGAVK